MRWFEMSKCSVRQPPTLVTKQKNIAPKSNQAIYSDFLMHYGISGQKWGVRKYQNEDGTLTEEGKKRYNKSSNEEASKKDVPESSTWKSKDAKYLSDEELNRRNSRLQREKQYTDLTTPVWKKGVKRVASDFITALTTLPVTQIVSDVTRKIYRGEYNKFVSSWLGNKVGVDASLKTK